MTKKQLTHDLIDALSEIADLKADHVRDLQKQIETLQCKLRGARVAEHNAFQRLADVSPTRAKRWAVRRPAGSDPIDITEAP